MGAMNIPFTCPYCGAGSGGPLSLAERSGHRIVFVGAMACPDYIPHAIRADYKEACLFRDLSPRVSVTLACRCLQEMIRDVLEVEKPTLRAALTEARSKVRPQAQWAIDEVCKVENVKAHMDGDVRLILDVEKGVADKLFWLVERLLQDWYVKRHETEPGRSV